MFTVKCFKSRIINSFVYFYVLSAMDRRQTRQMKRSSGLGPGPTSAAAAPQFPSSRLHAQLASVRYPVAIETEIKTRV